MLQWSEWDITFLAHGSVAVTVTYTYDGTGWPTTTVPGTLPRTGSRWARARATAERREWDSNPR